MNSHIINLWEPGEGLTEVEVAQGATLQELATERGLLTHEFTLDNRPAARADWSRTSLDDVSEIWATVGVKGAC